MISDYRQEIRRQRQVWSRKAVLRHLYSHWYAECVSRFSPLRPVVEVGAGCGNFKEYYPDIVATDVFRGGPWIDAVMDAHELALTANRIGNLFGFDLVHHLQRPLEFLRRALVALKPGGRLVLCEPALSPWSRMVYGLFHHEPVDTNWKLFELDGCPPEPDSTHHFANMAIPELLFWKHREQTLRLLSGCQLVSAQKFGFLLYPLTGGFGYRSFVPQTGFSLLQRIEDAALGPFANWLTGMRMLVVLEKTSV